MSYLNSKYTRRISLNKTIENMATEGATTTVTFTDGTYLKIYPWLSIQKSGWGEYHKEEVKAQVIVNGYYKNGDVIMATDED